jgi:hypothetical protein
MLLRWMVSSKRRARQGCYMITLDVENDTPSAGPSMRRNVADAPGKGEEEFDELDADIEDEDWEVEQDPNADENEYV